MIMLTTHLFLSPVALLSETKHLCSEVSCFFFSIYYVCLYLLFLSL